MRPSTYIPLLLLVYLGVMAYIGRYEYLAGRYVYYFGLIGLALACIVMLHLFLRRRERLKQNKDDN